MKFWMNKPGVVFSIILNGTPESLTGTLVYCDELGFTILNAADGKYYGYGIATWQNAGL